MFHQQSPDLQPQPLSNFRASSYDEVQTKNEPSEISNYSCGPYNCNVYPSAYPFQSFNQGFNDLKTPIMPDCSILQQRLPYPFNPNSRNQAPYPSSGYTQWPPNYQFPSSLPDTSTPYNFPSEDMHLWQQMKTLTSLEGLDNLQNYPRFNMAEYNQMMNMQYPKPGDTGSREKECVKCGLVTGDLDRRDANGHFLCYNCFCTNTSIDMLPLHKRSNYKTMSRKQTAKRTGLLCSNCKSDHTTLWRRNAEGQPVCNACGLYYRLHKTARPPSMRKETLQTRKRKTKRKPSICMKFMQPEYKTEPVNSLDHQMLTSSYANTSWM